MNSALTKTLTHGLMHGLKCNKNQLITAVSIEREFIHVYGQISEGSREKQSFPIDKIKPILFPMSSLTKEIDFKGERFVPYIELLRICNFDVDNMSDEELNNYKDNCRDIELMMFFEVEKLIEWHFNVFNLSPDEFIEVNETNNPYK